MPTPAQVSISSTVVLWNEAFRKGVVMAVALGAVSIVFLIVSAGHSTPWIYGGFALQLPGSLWWLLVYDHFPADLSIVAFWSILFGPIFLIQVLLFTLLYRAPWRDR